MAWVAHVPSLVPGSQHSGPSSWRLGSSGSRTAKAAEAHSSVTGCDSGQYPLGPWEAPNRNCLCPAWRASWSCDGLELFDGAGRGGLNQRVLVARLLETIGLTSLLGLRCMHREAYLMAADCGLIVGIGFWRTLNRTLRTLRMRYGFVINLVTSIYPAYLSYFSRSLRSYGYRERKRITHGGRIIYNQYVRSIGVIRTYVWRYARDARRAYGPSLCFMKVRNVRNVRNGAGCFRGLRMGYRRYEIDG